MKKILLALMLLMGVSTCMQAQDSTESEETEEDFYNKGVEVHFKGTRPTISDFVSAVFQQEELGEALGEMKDNWKKHLCGQVLPKGRSIIVDTRNGYVRYNAEFVEEEESPRYSHYIEFCYWNYTDGKHKLVAENIVSLCDGKPYAGQYSGVSFYMYDSETRLMKYAYESELGIDPDMSMPEDTNLIVHKLPQTGKTIEYAFFAPSGNKSLRLTWNGSKFVKEK